MTFDEWWCHFQAGVQARTSGSASKENIQEGTREHAWFRGDWALGRCPDECAAHWCAAAATRRAGGVN